MRTDLRRGVRLLVIACAMSSMSLAADKLVVSPNNPRQLSNSNLQFTAVFNKKDVTAQTQWTSSDPTVATITDGGIATLHAPGATTITATAKNQHAATVLTVFFRKSGS